MISSGNEAVLPAVDYLDYLIDDPATRVIALFLETVREPERFVAALDRAADRGKPVVVLKVGRSERARRAITSHTGGLAGEARVFSAVLRAHRAIEVGELDEMVEVLACCQGPRWPTGRRLAVMTASGGQAELILDLATAAGLHLPPLSDAARARDAAVDRHAHRRRQSARRLGQRRLRHELPPRHLAARRRSRLRRGDLLQRQLRRSAVRHARAPHGVRAAAGRGRRRSHRSPSTT